MQSKQVTSSDVSAWADQVKGILRRDWSLSFEYAGLTAEDVVDYYRMGLPPHQFVAWYAEKYGLIDFRAE